jgi:hypothetical protein
MAVYLLHSTVPLVLPDGREVRHYLGWTGEGDFPRRLRAHRANHHSAKIVQAFLAAGGELCLGNYYPGLDRTAERQMKRNGHIGNRCLRCQISRLQRELRDRERDAHSTPAPPAEPS